MRRAANRLIDGLEGLRDFDARPRILQRLTRLEAGLFGDAKSVGYLGAILEDGDARVITIGLRHAANAIGGMTALAAKTGLSRETLYRTLSERGNPRLDTLAAILAAFGLRLSVQPAKQAARSVDNSKQSK